MKSKHIDDKLLTIYEYQSNLINLLSKEGIINKNNLYQEEDSINKEDIESLINQYEIEMSGFYIKRMDSNLKRGFTQFMMKSFDEKLLTLWINQENQLQLYKKLKRYFVIIGILVSAIFVKIFF